MRMMLLACCVAALAGFSARAATVDDVIESAKRGESEEKQIALIEKDPGEIVIGAPDVLRLRDAKVSEKVILAMLRHVPADAAAAVKAPQSVPVPPPAPARSEATVPPAPDRQVAPPNAQPQAPVAEAPRPFVVPGSNGQLTIDNLDDRAWSYMYEPAIQTIWIAPAGRGSLVQAHSGTTVSMRPGSYKIRFSGSNDEGLPMTVFAGERSAISLSRLAAEGGDALNASIYEHGERKTSGKLALLGALPPPQEVVVERQIVEQPVYYYNSPSVYYYGGGYYPYSNSRYYYSRPSYGGYGYSGGSGLNFNFRFGGGSSRGGRR